MGNKALILARFTAVGLSLRWLDELALNGLSDHCNALYITVPDLLAEDAVTDLRPVILTDIEGIPYPD